MTNIVTGLYPIGSSDIVQISFKKIENCEPKKKRLEPKRLELEIRFEKNKTKEERTLSELFWSFRSLSFRAAVEVESELY